MLHLRSGVLAFSLLPALAACTTWTNPDKGPQHFSRDNANCEKEALATVQPSYQTQKYTNGKNSQEYTIDASEYLRERVRTGCLRRNGWISHVRWPWEDSIESTPPPAEPRVAEPPHRPKRRLTAAR